MTHDIKNDNNYCRLNKNRAKENSIFHEIIKLFLYLVDWINAIAKTYPKYVEITEKSSEIPEYYY